MMEDTFDIDQPHAVRTGEELPHAKLQAYLAQHLPDARGEIVVRQFPSGHSNLTYALQIGEREYVLRRPPFGAKIATAHDMGREYRILAHLHPVYPRVPRPYVYCEDESVIGAPFYVMERVSGLILRARPPEGIARMPELMRDLSVALIDNLAAIHALDYRAAGLESLGKPAGYIARQVRGWAERYLNAQTDSVLEIERVARWLDGNQPRESGAALIHNDYKYDNVVFDPNVMANLSEAQGQQSPSSNLQIASSRSFDSATLRAGSLLAMTTVSIRAVLDWEMATVGDPLMDLGTSLGYWVEPNDPPELRAASFGPTMLAGNLNRAELVERYARVSGRDVSSIQFYYVYALFKIAVIVQQIYKRWKVGASRDERFAGLGEVVKVLGRVAVSHLDKSP